MADNSLSSPSPFSFPDGDVILRSVDGIDFRVHITLLSVASPFFHDMFSLPQTSKEVQIIQMTEKADVLLTILRLIYPVEEPPAYHADLVLDVYKAADKLQITRVQPIARRRLCAWLHALSNPLEAWAIAVWLGIHEAIVSEKQRFISADTMACRSPKGDSYLKAIPAEEFAILIQTKEAAVQEGWRYIVETFTCLLAGPPYYAGLPVVDCTYCVRFVHYYRSATGLQIFQPKSTDFDLIRDCHKFAKGHKCLRGYEARDNMSLKHLQRRVQVKVSTILSGS